MDPEQEMQRMFTGAVCAAALLFGTSPAAAETVGDATAELVSGAQGTGSVLLAAERLRLALGLPIVQRASEPTGNEFDPTTNAFHAVIAPDGMRVAFLVGGSGGFLHDFDTGANESFSLSYDGSQSVSVVPSGVSAYARYVSFDSLAPTLVPGDDNGFFDVFVRDRQGGVTERASVNSAEEQAEGRSANSAMTPDGRFIAFASDAPNLVENDTNGWTDLFLRDRQTGTTERLTVAHDGGQTDLNSGPVFLSDDGRYAAFLSVATNLVPDDGDVRRDVFVRDRQLGTNERVNLSPEGKEADADADWLAFSGDGRFVAYGSAATNLVPGDGNGASDVFVYDRAMGTAERVSVGSSGEEGDGDSLAPAINADGRYVTFVSEAANLVPGDFGEAEVLVHDRLTGETEIVSVSALGEADHSAFGPEGLVTISADGRWIAFSSIASRLASGDTDLSRTDAFRAPNPLFWDAPAPAPPMEVN